MSLTLSRTMDRRNELAEIRTGETVMRKKWRTETRREVTVKEEIVINRDMAVDWRNHDVEKRDKRRHGLKKQWCGKKWQTVTRTEETMMGEKGDRRRRGKNGWADGFVKKTTDWLIQKEGLQYGEVGILIDHTGTWWYVPVKDGKDGLMDTWTR